MNQNTILKNVEATHMKAGNGKQKQKTEPTKQERKGGCIP